MKQLFSEKKLETYLNDLDTSIKNSIERYNNNAILNLEIDQEVDRIIKEQKLNVPKLLLDQLKVKIDEKKITGDQFPAGTTYRPGQLYDIEIAVYSIPVEGDILFFNYQPKNYQAKQISAQLKPNSIIIELNYFSKINGNDQVIDRLKSDLKQHIEITNNYLSTIQEEVTEFSIELETKIKKYLIDTQMRIKSRNETIDKLNPFK